MDRVIRKVAVLGAGVMGARIAAHFANVGVRVILLDIPCRESGKLKNKFAIAGLENALKSNPASFYKKEFSALIETGNFEDDLEKIREADWVVEAVVENLEIKRALFEQVEQFISDSTIVSTNTSGIPVHLLSENRSEVFQRNFLGTHFFNPPRYLKLLEIIPTHKTDPSVTSFLTEYADVHLGKSVVECKDTPDFIANRIGIFGLMNAIRLMQKYELTVTEVDRLTGPVIGRPKSATFRTADVVGLDTLVHVADHLCEALPLDEKKEIFAVPVYLRNMIERKWMGDKSGQGFYKKIKNEKEESEILSLDVHSLEYLPQQKVSLPSLEMIRTVDDIKERLRMLFKGQDKGAKFISELIADTLIYSANRIPEISDNLYNIDRAMKGGFGWELGPFEIWDAVGFSAFKHHEAPDWVNKLSENGVRSFYERREGQTYYYDIRANNHVLSSGGTLLILNNLRDTKTVERNNEASLIDLGDRIACLEFHTKMNAIGPSVIAMINKSLDRVEKEFDAMVIGNQAANFSAGANLALLLMAINEGEYDEIDLLARQFQNVNMRIKYFSKPVVVAPHGLTLGGGCEIVLHAQHVQAFAETYTGLVETGVGLIPAAGGTKEMTLRTMERVAEDAISLPYLKETFTNIAMAKVSASAHEAAGLGILRKSDGISMNKDRLISDAKTIAVSLVNTGYNPPVHSKVKVVGKTGLATVKMMLHIMYEGGFITGHDRKISEKLGYVMCGGDLSEQSEVSEQYLLNLEREAFLSLCGERKTQERIQYTLKSGKALRN